MQVKADSEGAGARSYNYRVVMYAGGAELDMRGRCSAGQKVQSESVAQNSIGGTDMPERPAGTGGEFVRQLRRPAPCQTSHMLMQT